MLKKVLYAIYSVVTVFCIFYGAPLAIVNITRDTRMAIIYAIIAGVGVVLLLVGAFIAVFKKKKAKKDVPPKQE